MQVQSLECQLTQAQLKRYLAGQALPDVLLDQLERHLQACPDCLGQAKKLRREMGGGETPADTPKTSPMAAVLHQVKRAVERPTPATLLDPPGHDGLAPSPLEVLKQPRNLVLSMALAICLVLMSTVMRDPTSLLGSRATVLASSKEQPKETDQDTKKDPLKESGNEKEQLSALSKESAADGKAVVTSSESKESVADPADEEGAEQASTTVKPPIKHEPLGGEVMVADSTPVKPVSPPKAVAKAKPKAASLRRATVRRPSAPRRTEQPPGNVVRVYDESGKPKNLRP